MSDLPKGLLITEGVTMKEGVVNRHIFGNPVESNPDLAYGPEVVRADLAAEQKHELLMAICSAYELLSQGNGMRALSVLRHTIDEENNDD